MVPVRVEHRQSIDLARFLAAFGVVAAHVFAAENGWIGHLALAVFLIMTSHLAVESMQRSGGRYDWARRAPRMLVPWLFWCLVYKAVLVQITDGADKYRLLTDPYSLLVGPFVHLWFLPFVLLASLSVAPAGRLVRSRRDVLIGSCCLAVLGIAAFLVAGRAGLPTPFAQWASAVPSYAYGLLAGLAMIHGGAAWPLFAMAVLCVTGYAVTGEVWMLHPFLAALALRAVWNLPLYDRLLPHLGHVAFGIYLTHPFFLLVVFKLFGPQVNGWLALWLTFVLAWVATIGLRMVPFLRRMV